MKFGAVAQFWLEHRTVDPKVAGSIPVGLVVVTLYFPSSYDLWLFSVFAQKVPVLSKTLSKFQNRLLRKAEIQKQIWLKISR